MDVSIDSVGTGGCSPSQSSVFPHTHKKMAAALLFLICAGAVLYSAKAQDSYIQLSDIYKKGVDLAVEQLNSHVGVHHHFRFLRSLEKSEIEVKQASSLILSFVMVLDLKNYGGYLCLYTFQHENFAFMISVSGLFVS